jgi:DNA-binding response OmpR family regulator
MPQRSVLIVEDDRTTAASIELYVRHAGFAVDVAHDGREALAYLDERRPLAVILDVMLPHVDGLQICKRVREESDTPVIVVSARTEESDRLAGLQLGADDYVTKPFSPRELVARLQAVLRRSGVRTERAGLVLEPRHHEASVNGVRVALTPTEFRVLEVFAANPGRVFSRDDLIRLAFGHAWDGLDRTVDAHIMNVRRKVRVAGGPEQVIATVFGVGYTLRAP